MRLRVNISKIVIALVALLLSAGLIKAVMSAWQPGDPLANSRCNSCHVAQDGGKSAADSRMLLMGQERLCTTCHKDALKASHPSGIHPSMQIPEIFPLDWKGDLTCSSCHYIHEGGHGQMRSNLRGKNYCLACHNEGFFSSMADSGQSIMFSGHLSDRQNIALSGIDAYSKKCMTCHDKQTNLPGLTVGFGNGLVRHGGGTNHPIGSNYQEAYKSGTYRNVMYLPKEIMLPDGMVSCISCHESYKKKHGKLIPEATCISCHDL
jgi:predicted CXXCH cytochrome family protein